MRAWNIPKILVGIALVVFFGVFLLHGFDEHTLRLNIRLSARFSFLIFCLAFVASALQYFFKGQFTFWLLMNRKFIGISFAIIHLIHLSFLMLLQYKFHPLFEMAEMTSLLGGVVAYLFVVLMLITSFDGVKSKLSNKVWKVIHTVGGYWIAIFFLLSYGLRVINEWEYVPLLLLLISVIVFRLLKAFKIKG